MRRGCPCLRAAVANRVRRVWYSGLMRSAFLALALAASACTASSTPATPPERPSDFVKVIDGETLVIRGETVRLSNVDAPRLPPAAVCSAEAALGVQAASRLKSIIATASGVRLERVGKDRDGATLARVILPSDADVGDALVFMGVAADWRREPWDWCGPADYAREGGPKFVSGPEDNKPFLAWVANRLAAGASTEPR